MMRKILITGGAGFIGSFIAERAILHGYQVRVIDNLTPQVHPTGKPDYLHSEIEFIQADVRNKYVLAETVKDVDFVIHCAAAVGVGQSMYQPRHYIDTNVTGTAAVLEAIVERRPKLLKKLIVLASMTSYGEGLYRRPSDGKLLRVNIRTELDIERSGWELTCPDTGEVLEPAPTPEDSVLLATNVYALTKRYQEELALSLGRSYGFPVTCLRLFNVYGPRQSLSNPYTGVLAIFLSRLLNNQPPIIYEDGGQTRDFVSIHDVVQAVILALNSPQVDYQVLNIGTGVARSVRHIALTLAHLLGKSQIEPRITGQFRQGDIRHCTADISRARELIGFSPSVNWEQSLLEIIEWSRTVPTSDRFEQAQTELTDRGLIK